MEACPRRLRDECPLSKAACGVISHHLFYPRRKYVEAGPIAEQFRELQTNRVPMCHQEEIELHKNQPEGPPMPTMEVMSHCVEVEAQRRELAVRDLRRP